MAFSLGSYLLGVGTVLGTLAFGFGGGVFLTHTAMKESPAGQTRVERLARAEPETSAAPEAPVAQVASTPNQTAPAPNEATNRDQDHTASVGAARKSEPEAPRQNQAALEPEPVKQAATGPQPQKQIEQTEAKPLEPREMDRSAERSRRYAARRQPDNGAPRMRQRMFMVQEEPAQGVVVSRLPGQHFDLFGGFFGRPADAND